MKSAHLVTMAIVGPGLLTQAQVPEGDGLPAGRGIMNNEQLIIIMHNDNEKMNSLFNE